MLHSFTCFVEYTINCRNVIFFNMHWREKTDIISPISFPYSWTYICV